MIKPPTITAKRQRKQSIESFIAAISDANSLNEKYQEYRAQEQKKFGSPNRGQRHTLAQLPQLNERATNNDSGTKSKQKNVGRFSPNRHSMPILGSTYHARKEARKSLKASSWTKKANNAKRRREAREKEKAKLKLELIRQKKIRINAFRDRTQLEKIQREWLKMIRSVKLIVILKSQQHRKKLEAVDKLKAQEYEKAAIIIQSKARKHYQSKMKARFLGAARILIKYEWKARLNLRAMLRRKNATKIQNFFIDHSHNSKFASVVKSFRYRVIVAQRCARDFIACRKARLYAMGKKWESLESPYLKKLLKTLKCTPGGGSELRDAKLIDESKKEIATLVERWKKTQKKLMALADRKEKCESEWLDHGSQRNTSYQGLKTLFGLPRKKGTKKEICIQKDLRKNAITSILKHERRRFIHGDYAMYRLECAAYSPSKPRIKRNSTTQDASLWLNLHPRKDDVNKPKRDEDNVGKDENAPPAFPTWRLFSSADMENFYDQMTIAFQVSRIRESQKEEGIDLFNEGKFLPS